MNTPTPNRRDILKALEIRFGAIPSEIARKVESTDVLSKLEALLEKAILCGDVKELLEEARQ